MGDAELFRRQLAQSFAQKDVTADLASTPLRNWHASWTIQLSNR
jgi:hypothetical protein